MNRFIGHWFRLYDHRYPFCDNCRKIPDELEISDDTDACFPAETRILESVLADLPYTSDGSFRRCPHCRSFYWYREYQPGGSEDAMRTVTYETLSRTGLYGVYLELMEALPFSSSYWQEYERNGNRILSDLYREKHESLEKEASLILNEIENCRELLIRDMIACLLAFGSAAENPYYLKDLKVCELLTAERLIEKIRLTPGLDFSEDLIQLTRHPNRKAARVIQSFLREKNSLQ
jgi:hypothetical protein